MPANGPLDRLATVAARLGERRRQVEELRRLVEPLRAGNLEAVDGEWELLGELDASLGEAFDLLAAMPGGDHARLLDQLEEVLDGVSWDLADDVRPELDEKSQRQTTLLRQVGIDVKDWENRLSDLAKVVDGARFDGAPFSALEADLRAARSVIASIRSALTDRLYGGLPALREAAAAKIKQFEDSVEKARSQVARVKKLVKQVDLLIMQVAAGDGDYEYRVLMRSADRYQTRGINIIQDVRRLSRADRDWMLEQLAQLTASVNQGLRAAHGATHPGAARTISPADPTVETATRDAARSLAMLGTFMFRMVIPEQMQTYLRREQWSFSITTNDLELPWELVSFEAPESEAGADALYLCLERSVSRMPLGEVFPPAPPRRQLKPNQKRRMLLIHSDPEGNLPAAAGEVDAIARELDGQLDFERVGPKEATNANLNRILMGEPFDFIHYAGHAYFDKDAPNLSGLQLKDGRLTADKIRLLSRGGSLVFLNACESGTVARDNEPQRVSYLLNKPEPVVGLASAFVYSGALGCVGSLWPVYDKPAADLAVSFYRSVLAGEPTGEALRLARAEVRASYPREITWAGYVLYGDPTFRLTET